MNGVIGILGVLAILLVAGFALGLLDRRNFDARWLLIAAALVLLNDALLTRGYGLVPNLIGNERNWLGKFVALGVTLAVAALPAFGWRRSGLTLAQRAGSWRTAWPVALLYVLFFLAIALAFDSDPSTAENVAFQLTMPGLEEEPFYRGILLLALDQAFRRRWRLLGVDWGWGALFSCALFGLGHALGFGADGFGFDPPTFLLTGIPALLAVWLRYRTGSLLLPVLLHNFGNVIVNLV